jgi:uncharacterized protein (TIGR02246 family)
MKKLMICIVLLSALRTASLSGAETRPISADEAAIRANVAAYIEAYNRQDAAALAALWSDYGIYQNPLTGKEVSGREAIEQEFAAVLNGFKDAKLDVIVTSIDFISPSVAVEEGTAQVVSADSSPEITEYSAVHVKQGDKWLLDRVTEKENVAPVSHYEQLKPLEWLIGTWIDEDDEARVEGTCQWAKNQNFITRSFTVEMPGQSELTGVQFIGWDGSKGKIRSWAFDSDGGFTEGTWTNKDDRWIVESAAVLPDGRKSSSINVMKLLDDGAVSWQITGRDVDGEILPNLPEVKITRTPSLEGATGTSEEVSAVIQ